MIFTRDLTETEQERRAQEACLQHRTAFNNALVELDVETAMTRWSAMAEATWLLLANPNQSHRGATGRCTKKMQMTATIQPLRFTASGAPMTRMLQAAAAAWEALRPMKAHLRRGMGVLPVEALRQWKASLRRQTQLTLLDPEEPWAPLPTFDNLPTLAEVETMDASLKSYFNRRLAKEDRARLSSWKQRMKEAWSSMDRGLVYRWIKEENWNSVAFVARPDGTLTANIEEMDQLLHGAWDPILRRYACTDEPSADAFMAKYGHLVKRHEMTVKPMTAKRLREQLSRTSSKKATGLDGWGVANLKRLPLSAHLTIPVAQHD